MRNPIRWALALLAVTALAPHIGALGNAFVFDDNGVIVRNESVTQMRIGEIWTGPYWPHLTDTNLYRPVTSSSFALSWAMGGGSPAVFIATNLLLHVAVTLLAFGLLRRIFPERRGLALCASLLFAVHPIHVEAVVGIVGRAELLAALFGIASYRIWLDSEQRRGFTHTLAAAFLWLLAILSKEGAIAIPGLFLLHRLGLVAPASVNRRFRWSDLVWPAALVVAIALRMNALDGLSAPRVNRIDNPLAELAPHLRILGAGGVLLRQLGQILCLIPFSPDYSYAEVRPGSPLYAGGGAVLLLAGAALVYAMLRGRSNPAGFGILFFFFAWIVTSNIGVAIGTVQADRIFYLPSLGIFLVAAAGAARILAGRQRVYGIPLLAFATIGFGASSWIESGKWRAEQTLFEVALKAAPRSVKVRSNLAAIYLKQRDAETGRKVLALLAPAETDARGFGSYLHWKAKATLYTGDRDSAKQLFREALAARADSSETLVELGNIAIMEGDGVEAMRAFDHVARIGRLAMHSRIGRASALSLQGRYEESASEWIGIVRALPDSIPVRVACAWNLRKAARAREAAEILRDGLAAADDGRLWAGLCEALIARGDSPEEALAAARRAVEIDPSQENLTNLALAMIASAREKEARATRDRVQDLELLREIDEALRATPR